MSTIAPKQKRSAQRLNQLLDAAAALIAAHGVHGFTLSAVGQRTGTAPGSLYQYFRSKQDVVEALHQRYAQRILSLLEGLTLRKGSSAQVLAGLVDDIIDAFTPFYRETPVYGVLRHAMPVHLEALEDALDREIAEKVSALLAQIAPSVGRDDLVQTAQVVVEITDALLLRAAQDASWAEEARHVLRAFLFSRLSVDG